MKRKGLPAYFVLPTQMHKECGLATLDCYGKFSFSCERPSIVTGNIFSRANDPRLLREFFSRVNDPRLLREFFFLVQTTLLPQKDQESNKQSKCFVYCLKIATFAAKEKEI